MAEILTIGEPLVLFASKDLNMSLTDAKNFHKFLAGAETVSYTHLDVYKRQLNQHFFLDFC